MSSLSSGNIPTDAEVLTYARLKLYRSIMTRIHEGGSIYYDAGRMAAYNLLAKMASEERRTLNGKM